LIQKERAALDQRAEAEDARWEKQRSRLDAARKRART
jgi:colicin import membrane protein